MSRRRDVVTDTPEHLHARFQDAFNRHDLESMVSMYEPDAVLAQVGRTARGVDAIREAYRHVLGLRPTIRVETVKVLRAGDLVMMQSRWTWTATGSDGATIVSEGRSVEIARR